MEGRRLTQKDVGSIVSKVKGTSYANGTIDLSYIAFDFGVYRLVEVTTESYKLNQCDRDRKTGELSDWGRAITIEKPYLDNWLNLTEYEESHGRKALDELFQKLLAYRDRRQSGHMFWYWDTHESI